MGSRAAGKPVAFWPGSLRLTGREPVCLRFRLTVDGDARRLRIPVGRGACR
jgi:hypothetical protein